MSVFKPFVTFKNFMDCGTFFACSIFVVGCILSVTSWKLGAPGIFAMLYMLLGTVGFINACLINRKVMATKAECVLLPTAECNIRKDRTKQKLEDSQKLQYSNEQKNVSEHFNKADILLETENSIVNSERKDNEAMCDNVIPCVNSQYSVEICEEQHLLMPAPGGINSRKTKGSIPYKRLLSEGSSKSHRTSSAEATAPISDTTPLITEEYPLVHEPKLLAMQIISDTPDTTSDSLKPTTENQNWHQIIEKHTLLKNTKQYLKYFKSKSFKDTDCKNEAAKTYKNGNAIPLTKSEAETISKPKFRVGSFTDPDKIFATILPPTIHMKKGSTLDHNGSNKIPTYNTNIEKNNQNSPILSNTTVDLNQEKLSAKKYLPTNPNIKAIKVNLCDLNHNLKLNEKSFVQGTAANAVEKKLFKDFKEKTNKIDKCQNNELMFSWSTPLHTDNTNTKIMQVPEKTQRRDTQENILTTALKNTSSNFKSKKPCKSANVHKQLPAYSNLNQSTSNSVLKMQEQSYDNVQRALYYEKMALEKMLRAISRDNYQDTNILSFNLNDQKTKLSGDLDKRRLNESETNLSADTESLTILERNIERSDTNAVLFGAKKDTNKIRSGHMSVSGNKLASTCKKHGQHTQIRIDNPSLMKRNSSKTDDDRISTDARRKIQSCVEDVTIMPDTKAFRSQNMTNLMPITDNVRNTRSYSPFQDSSPADNIPDAPIRYAKPSVTESNTYKTEKDKISTGTRKKIWSFQDTSRGNISDADLFYRKSSEVKTNSYRTGNHEGTLSRNLLYYNDYSITPDTKILKSSSQCKTKPLRVTANQESITPIYENVINDNYTSVSKNTSSISENTIVICKDARKPKLISTNSDIVKLEKLNHKHYINVDESASLKKYLLTNSATCLHRDGVDDTSDSVHDNEKRFPFYPSILNANAEEESNFSFKKHIDEQPNSSQSAFDSKILPRPILHSKERKNSFVSESSNSEAFTNLWNQSLSDNRKTGSK